VNRWRRWGVEIRAREKQRISNVRGNRTILILEPARKRIRPKVPKGRSKNAMRVYRYERAKKKKGEREREREKERERKRTKEWKNGAFMGNMVESWIRSCKTSSSAVMILFDPLRSRYSLHLRRVYAADARNPRDRACERSCRSCVN
jgi:hypothetical protein